MKNTLSLTFMCALASATILALPFERDAADTDGDGVLNIEEYAAAYRSARPDNPNLSDKNLKAWFNVLDTDRDGDATQKEFTALEQKKLAMKKAGEINQSAVSSKKTK